MKCRSCSANQEPKEINIGPRKGLAVVKFKDKPDERDDYHSLDLWTCSNCNLVQLVETVPPGRLFSEFHYLSGVNQSMNDALFDIVKDVEKHVSLKPGDIVIDIGANDGTLLSYYRKYVTTVGFEPARNIIPKLWPCDNWVQDYFSIEGYHCAGFKKKAKVITAIAMFYDLEDPNHFLKDIYEILDDNGVFVVQMNDLDRMIQNVSVDNICHEHLTYYNIDTLLPLLRRHGLYPIEVSYNQINGGSIRVICSKKENGMFPPGLHRQNPDLEEMFHRFDIEKKRLLKYIDKYGPIWAYGASTRGNTLLQLLGLDSTKIVAIADRNPKKWGKYTAGGNIQIISEDMMRQKQPDNLLVLPYYFEEEFLKREMEYLKKGGKMIFPLPKFRIYTADKEGNLKVHGL